MTKRTLESVPNKLLLTIYPKGKIAKS